MDKDVGLAQGGASRQCSPLFVSTGCTSADNLLVPLLQELRDRGRLGEVTGVGGVPLREQGVRLFFDTTFASSVGLVASLRAALRHAADALPAYRQIRDYFLRRRPALAILVDNPGHNLRLLALARRCGIPVVYYVTPELWSIWRWEAQAIARQASVLLPLFRSEGETYQALGGNVHWIGHPLIDLLGPVSLRQNDNLQTPTIGLFPGSRVLEIQELMPVLQGAAAIIQRNMPGARFVICSANAATGQMIRKHLWAWETPVTLVHRCSHDVLARCDLLLTCSGTATLEAAILGVPLVAMYRMHYRLDRLISLFQPLSRYRFLALPNWLLDCAVVPELRNGEVCARRVAEEGLSLLRDATRRHAVIAGLAEVRALLGPPGAVRRAADLVEEFFDRATEAVCPEPEYRLKSESDQVCMGERFRASGLGQECRR